MLNSNTFKPFHIIQINELYILPKIKVLLLGSSIKDQSVLWKSHSHFKKPTYANTNIYYFKEYEINVLQNKYKMKKDKDMYDFFNSLILI